MRVLYLFCSLLVEKEQVVVKNRRLSFSGVAIFGSVLKGAPYEREQGL